MDDQNVEEDLEEESAKESEQEVWPFLTLVLIVYDSQDYLSCNGILLSTEYSLIAAHCCTINSTKFAIFTPNDITPLLNLYNSNISCCKSAECLKQYLMSNDLNQIIEGNCIVHPNYSSSNLTNDVALFKLNRHVELGDNIKPINIFQRRSPVFAGKICYIAAWQKADLTKLVFLQLEQQVVELNKKIMQKKNFTSDLIITNSTINDDTTHILPVDFGGPLVCDGHPSGILSFGFYERTPSGRISTYYAWSRTSKYISWIVNVIGNDIIKRYNKLK